MLVTVSNVYDNIRTNFYDIDVNDYKNWLKENNESPSDDSLMEYINDEDIDPDDWGDDFDLVETIVDCDKLLKELDNETR